MADKSKDRVKEFRELFERLPPAEQADCMRRMEATIAVRAGTATAEQLALDEDTRRHVIEAMRPLEGYMIDAANEDQ